MIPPGCPNLEVGGGQWRCCLFHFEETAASIAEQGGRKAVENPKGLPRPTTFGVLGWRCGKPWVFKADQKVGGQLFDGPSGCP
jgi:hypothetical protein